MRGIEEIDKELAETREALSQAEGGKAEVYSRIVGYYRSVRNWNKGKAEEYTERKLFQPEMSREAPEVAKTDEALDARLLLFVRPACPACPGAKDAASRLGIPVALIDTDTEAGMAEAEKRQVMSTPTAILLGKNGLELGRARDSVGIAQLVR